jgi:hypothetical protein
VVSISVRKTTTMPPPPPPQVTLHLSHFQATYESDFWYANSVNPTRRNMEDDLNIFENGRGPHFFQIEDMLNILLSRRLPLFRWRRPPP